MSDNKHNLEKIEHGLGHIGMHLIEKAEAEPGVRGALYGAGGTAACAVALGVAFSLPISLPVVATLATLGAIKGFFGEDL